MELQYILSLGATAVHPDDCCQDEPIPIAIGSQDFTQYITIHLPSVSGKPS